MVIYFLVLDFLPLRMHLQSRNRYLSESDPEPLGNRDAPNNVTTSP